MNRIFIDKIRKNHALEHGTIAVLRNKGISPTLFGSTIPTGFVLCGQLSKQAALECGLEALASFRQGHWKLAISRDCGTNLVLKILVTALVTAVFVRHKKNIVHRVTGTTIGVLAGSLFGKPIGNMIQKRYTTMPELGEFKIIRIRSLKIWKYNIHYFSTGIKSS